MNLLVTIEKIWFGFEIIRIIWFDWSTRICSSKYIIVHLIDKIRYSKECFDAFEKAYSKEISTPM